MKKKICLVTNWYPTEENPVQGCFFKEQAFVVENEFDFIIFRYQEKIKKNPIKKDCVFISNIEKNTIEYNAVAYIPLSVYICDMIYNIKIKLCGKNIEGIGKYASPKRKKLVKRKLIALFSKIDQNVDVFYCVDAQSEAYNLQCLAENFGKPYVVGEHAPVPWPGTLINDINKYAIEKANLFLAISNDKIRQILLQNIKISHVFYIGNLVNENNMIYIPKDIDHVRTFIIVAAHSFYKNYSLFIRVMNILTEATKVDFKVMIVGYGANKGYTHNVEELENEIKNSKFADRTELISEVPHKRMGEMYNRADAFVMTSIQEGQPVSAMEAACCGLPIFSTKCGGIEDYVDDEMGRIYNIVDAEGMAYGLKNYLEGNITFNSAVIRKKAVDKFGTEAFTKNFTRAFNEVIDNVQDKCNSCYL